jgi:hypothetical protein
MDYVKTVFLANTPDILLPNALSLNMNLWSESILMSGDPPKLLLWVVTTTFCPLMMVAPYGASHTLLYVHGRHHQDAEQVNF